MKDLELFFIEEEECLLDLDHIIKLNEQIKNHQKNVKIILVSNKSKIELGTFIDIFNKLIGLDMIDFAISTSSHSIVHIKKTKDLKEQNIKNKHVGNFDSLIQSLVDTYRDYYSLNQIFYLATNDHLFHQLKLTDIHYKKIDGNLYNTLFHLIV